MINIATWFKCNPTCQSLRAISLLFVIFAAGCSNETEQLVVYAGKGLRPAVEEVKANFEKRENVSINVVYAGSKTLLTTLRSTNEGDVFLPGSFSYIKNAGNLITHSDYVALHVPIFAISASVADQIKTYADLSKPGIRIAVGNKEMSAIGRVTEEILDTTQPDENFRGNIIITASTVNELLYLVTKEEVDAALVWKDMLLWEDAKDLVPMNIPQQVNRPKEIWIGTLSTSNSPNLARRFVDYASSDGRGIFEKHGFGQ